MVFDKMAAICLDFKWLGIQISDPFQNPGHLKPNSDCTASLSLIPLAFIELQLSSGVDNLDFEIEGFFASGTNFLDPAEDFSDVSFWSKIRKSSSSLAMTPSFVAKFLFRSTIIERSFWIRDFSIWSWSWNRNKGWNQVCANFSKIPHDAHLYILMRNSAL